ncbi:golgin subfamily A member 6-like protein 24 [Macrobrachium nipponense]|uniref:golgin subfamily A member 6-like protein 24 n=1 Tax=Macrobrachium nipponense TaxID=159736 RepID=UPI0030C7B425
MDPASSLTPSLLRRRIQEDVADSETSLGESQSKWLTFQNVCFASISIEYARARTRPCELCLQVFGLNLLVFVLALVPCEVYYLIVQELLDIIQCRGPTTGHSLETLHRAVVAESWSPEVVETRLDSGSIETPASAGAVPWMALMAGALVLLLAVYWKPKLIECDDLDHDEDDQDGPTLDSILDTEDLECSEEEEEEEEVEEPDSDNDDDDMEELDRSDADSDDDVEEEEEEEEEELDSSDADSDEDAEEEVEEEFDSSDFDEDVEEEEEEEMEEKLDSYDDDEKEKKEEEKEEEEEEISETEEFETTEVKEEEEEDELERLLHEAKKDIVRLQKEILDKDLLIQKKAAEETEIKKENEVLKMEKERLQYQNRKLEEECKLALGCADVIGNLHKELMDETTFLENRLEEKDHMLRKRDVENRELRSYFQQTMVQKDKELESALERVIEISLELKEMETINEALASEKERLKRANEDYSKALVEKEREVNHLQDLLVHKAAEAEKDQRQIGILESQILDMKDDHIALQRQLELTKSENCRLEELTTCYKGQLAACHGNVAKLEDKNCELEKNLVNETQTNISLQNEVLILNDQVQSLQSALRHKESRLVSAAEALNNEMAKNEITGAELEVMKNWVSELGGENAKIKEDLGDAILVITSLKKELGEELKRSQILMQEVQAMKNWVSELGGQNAQIKEDLEDKCLEITFLMEELRDEHNQTQILRDEVQVMRNWVSELGGENATIKETLEEALLEVATLKKSLVKEKRNALHQRNEMETLLIEERKRGKELERESSEMILHYQEKLRDKDNEKDKLKERKEQLQKNLESAMCQLQNLESSLQLAEREICSLKKAENTNLQELEHLREECERLREKCRIQEENIIKERKRVKEYLRMQEEELKNQDKYMLMALLHGTAQRNFYLEHIPLAHRNKDLDDETLKNSEEENKRLDQEEYLQQQLQKVEEDQYREYCNAQREKKDYGKQWEVLTQMVEDLIEGDDRKNC